MPFQPPFAAVCQSWSMSPFEVPMQKTSMCPFDVRVLAGLGDPSTASVETKLDELPLKTSSSTAPEMPGTVPVLLYCHTFQTPEPKTSQVVQVFHGVPVCALSPL